MSEIKTFDAIELIQKNLINSIKQYPDGSLTPREVISTLPISGDKEEFAKDINAKITTAIYQAANEFLKTYKPIKNQGFTPISDLKAKVDETKIRNDLLNKAVLKAIS